MWLLFLLLLLLFLCQTQFSSNSCNCCLIIWHIHISKMHSSSRLFRTRRIELESSSITMKNKAPLPTICFRHFALYDAEYGSEVVREFRQTMSRFEIYQELHNEILCCWSFWKGGSRRWRQTPDKGDCLDYLSVSDVRSTLWATMASRITMIEIRPCWERGSEGANREKRGKESEEWRIGMWLD